MTDNLRLLTHRSLPMAKVWNKDGTISPYSEGKNFIGTDLPVTGIKDLSDTLTTLASDKRSIVIRGTYLGDERAIDAEPDSFKKGMVLRKLSVHEDKPRHWVMFDIDDFEPLDYCPISEPVECTNEFIDISLPECFQGVSYHLQLSNSHGHESKSKSMLRGHIWFWLDTPYNSATLKQWALSKNINVDKALFNPVQVHYTSDPIFADGVTDPLTCRSFYVDGDIDDTVGLIIDDQVKAVIPKSRSQKLSDQYDGDPVAKMLYQKGMVKGSRQDQGLNITCPRASHHSSESVESATVYYTANTGGYSEGIFKCLHEHCQGVAQGAFKDALGYEEDTDGAFDNLVKSDVTKVDGSEIAANHVSSDLANAKRLLKKYGGKLMLNGKSWRIWEKTRWVEDSHGATKLACGLSSIVAKELAKATNANADKDHIKSLKKLSHDCEMASTIRNAISMLSPFVTVSQELLDTNPDTLNTLSGPVNLKTGQLDAPCPKDLHTKSTTVPYDANATCPTWEKVILDICMGDVDLVSFLQRWFGYCVTGHVSEQVMVVHYGNGSNGKSSILGTIEKIIGDYSKIAAPQLLASDKSGNRHPTEIADLAGSRMVLTHESGENMTLREDFVKQATGDDKLKGRLMGQDFFEFYPSHKIQLLTNHKPKIVGTDDGIWRRVVLVPYSAKFGTKAQFDAGEATHMKDNTLNFKIKAEYSGILNWLIVGATQWYKIGLNPPESVLAASNDYREEQNILQMFVDEICTVGDDEECYLSTTSGGGIFPTYQRWAKSGGMHPLGKVRFADKLSAISGVKSIEEVRIYVGGVRQKRKLIHGISAPEHYQL